MKILGLCSLGCCISWPHSCILAASESWAWGQLDCEQPPGRTVRQLTGHCSERPAQQVCVSEVSERKEADLHILGLTRLQLGCVTLGNSLPTLRTCGFPICVMELILLISGVPLRVGWAPVSSEMLCRVLAGAWAGSELAESGSSLEPLPCNTLPYLPSLSPGQAVNHWGGVFCFCFSR